MRAHLSWTMSYLRVWGWGDRMVLFSEMKGKVDMSESLVVSGKRPVPEYLKHSTVYQVVLRNFTRDGNFRAATEMLEHVRSMGTDIVYVAPFVEMDRDMDVKGWSERQIKSGYGSPKNSYRISNYDKIDPEYGTDADFQAFNDKAHSLGMRVFMDLVYLHCGPTNVLQDLFSDAFERNEDGSVRTTIWNFPYVNFASSGVRKYLIDSMKHWMRLGCDGFRCDVGDQVPVDFWVEATTECWKINPELVMINEGTKTEWLAKAFDACYAWPWSFTVRHAIALKAEAHSIDVEKDFPGRMDDVRAYEATIPSDSLLFCFLDNHDTATDDWEQRFDRIHSVDAGNAAFVLTFLRRGLPLVFNGNEIADNSLNSFFAPVEHPARAAKTVDWARAVQPAGQKRLALLRTLAKLHHDDPIFFDGSMEWVTEGEGQGIVSFVRRLGERTVFVSANLSENEVRFVPKGWTVACDATRLLNERYEVLADGTCKIGPYGFLVAECVAR